MNLPNGVQLHVKWLGLKFAIDCLDHPCASDVLKAVADSLNTESAESTDETIKSLAHLTKSLCRFEAVLVMNNSEMADSKLRKAVLQIKMCESESD